jgi:hypothetical protein
VAWVKRFLPNRSAIRGLFHWEYSGWFIGIAWPLGVALTLYHNQSLGAFIAFGLAGFWSVGYWLTSDALGKKRSAFSGRRKSTVGTVARKKIHFYFVKYGVLAILIAFTAGCIWLAYSEQRKYEQYQVWQHLDMSVFMPPAGDITMSQFSMKNESGYDIYTLFAGCAINDITWTDGEHEDGYTVVLGDRSKLSMGPFSVIKPEISVVKGNGDGFASECLASYRAPSPPAPQRPASEIPSAVVCADITFQLVYSLSSAEIPDSITTYFPRGNGGLHIVGAEQKAPRIKEVRFFYSRGYWVQQVLGYDRSYCGGLPPKQH